MARGTSLSNLRAMLKAEIGDYAGANTTRDGELNTLLSNKQKWLASRYDWPFLEHRWDIEVSPNLQYQRLPTVEQDGTATTAVNFERPVRVEVFYNDVYEELKYGIGQNELNWMNFELGQQVDPIQRWRLADQIIVTADTAGSGFDGEVLGAGNVDVGAHVWKVTLVTAYGESPLAGSLSLTVSPSASQVSLVGIPVGADYTTARRVYRTKVGGSVFYLVGMIEDNTTTTYTDNIADANLGAAWDGESPLYVPRFEVWPVPVTAQTIRFTGQRALLNLSSDSDVCDLDDMLLVYFVAGEKLLRSKQVDAQLKLQMAEERLRMVRATYPCREEKYVLGGSDNDFYKDRKLTGMIIVR